MAIKRPAPAADRYIDDEDEEILEPVVRKARPAEIDDEEEEDGEVVPAIARLASKSRQRRLAIQEDDEEEQPKARVPRQRETNGEDDGLEDEDEDFHAPSSSRVAAGWGAAKALQSEGGDYTAEFKLTEDGTLVKFLEDAPVAVYRQHFLREKEGKKSYVCVGRGCPLCEDLGHTPDKKFAFNVVDLTQDTFGVSLLVAGPRLLGVLEKANSGKYGPLDKHYWEISRSGTGQKTTYLLSPVKDRYLEDDWKLNPAKIEGIIGKLKPLTADAIKTNSKTELRQIVAELDA